MISHENGVLVAPTGSGKTVMACRLIAERKVSVLILVHRKQLIEQWINHLSKFLNIDTNQIGQLVGNQKKPKGLIDIAMLQTLSKTKDLTDVIKQYGHIVVDECHHIPAISFESVLKRFRARYFLGLTATPYRKDGHQSIIYMQCGPIRYELTEKNSHPIMRKVLVKETLFTMPTEFGHQPPIHEVWDHLVKNEDRLKLVAYDVIECLKQKRFPLILSERKEHLTFLFDTINNILDDNEVKGFLIVGNMGKKARTKALTEIQESLANKQSIFILSTGSLIGEGFDLPQLDTLMLTMPISFRGRVVQYAGRLHRQAPNKSDVRIYDYLDILLPLTLSMFKKRLSAYKKIGYEINTTHPKIAKWAEKKPK
jgi:superfamily II DNA or RNA helicase